jgi:hypothetical protein
MLSSSTPTFFESLWTKESPFSVSLMLDLLSLTTSADLTRMIDFLINILLIVYSTKLKILNSHACHFPPFIYSLLTLFLSDPPCRSPLWDVSIITAHNSYLEAHHEVGMSYPLPSILMDMFNSTYSSLFLP